MLLVPCVPEISAKLNKIVSLPLEPDKAENSLRQDSN
jgi:hypothetical protein